MVLRRPVQLADDKSPETPFFLLEPPLDGGRLDRPLRALSTKSFFGACLDFWVVAMRADDFLLATVIVHMIG
jgi:hypothetical protein